MKSLVFVALGLSLAYWSFMAYSAQRSIRSIARLCAEPFEAPSQWPPLSVIIPARNEGDTLEAALRSKLSSDYPDLELLVVDDRSTDTTGEIADRLAAQDARVQVLHVKTLPPGWLGKLNALHEGTRRARGSWLLFSDADVHLERDALSRAIALCERKGLDHLAVFPELWSVGLPLDAALAAFVRLVFSTGRVWQTPDPTSRAYAGVGAFNLVRRTALERTGGFEWLRLELGDDMALGQMLKRSGARSAVANGKGSVGLTFYPSLRAMARGMEKGMTLVKFSAPLAVLVSAAWVALEVGPYAALAWGSGLVRVLGGLGAAAAFGSSVAYARWAGLRLIPAAVPILGPLLLGVMFSWKGISTSRRGGIVWRGTFYGARELMAGRRVQFP